MKPKKAQTAEQKAGYMPGLALADDPDWHKKRQEDLKVADDMLSELEGVSRRSDRPSRDSSSRRERGERGDRSRRRSPSYDRYSRRDRDRRSRHRPSRSPSPRRRAARSPPPFERGRNEPPSARWNPERGRPTQKRYDDDGPSRAVQRMSSPERWEIKQLIASGVVNASDYPGINDDTDFIGEAEEEIDVEVREEEPPFLAGQTKKTLQLSPVKVVKIPDGTMNRSALAGAALAKERRDLRQQQQNEEADSVSKDVNKPWLDPMPEPGQRQFAQDLRGQAMGAKNNMAEWKQATFNNATSFGKITSLSIQEQRESLPIFKLRNALVQAIREVSLFLDIEVGV